MDTERLRGSQSLNQSEQEEQDDSNQGDSLFVPLITPAMTLQNRIHSILLRDNCRMTKSDKEVIMNYLADLMILVSKQDAQIAVLQSKMDEYSALNRTYLDPLIEDTNKQRELNRKTYADIVKNNRNNRTINTKKKKEHIAIIRPMANDVGSDKTKTDITNRIDPAKLKIAVKRVGKVRNGGIIIETETEKELEIFRNEMEKTGLNNEYTFNPPKLKKPSIIIFGVEGQVSKETVGELLVSQHEGVDEEEVNVRGSLGGKKGTRHWIVELSPDAFHYIKYQDKINISWRRYNYDEYFAVRQCYRCAGIGHLARDCQRDAICRHCSSNEHKIHECEERSYCANCQIANEKYGLNLETGHGPFDKQCNQYQRAQAVQHDGQIPFFSNDLKIYSFREKPRVAVLVGTGISDDSLVICHRDLCAVTFQIDSQMFVFMSFYLPPCDSMDPTLNILDSLLVKYSQYNVILCADVNAKSTVWGPISDNRGDDLLMFLISHDVHVINDPEAPLTYSSTLRHSWIDIIATNSDLLDNYTDHDHISLSDHELITAEITTQHNKIQLKNRSHNYRNLRWIDLRTKLYKIPEKWNAENIENIDQLEDLIKGITNDINRACDESRRRSGSRKKGPTCPW
nr:uncharacterized protein LOC122270149 [Parasteatoda tepidariorum]